MGAWYRAHVIDTRPSVPSLNPACAPETPLMSSAVPLVDDGVTERITSAGPGRPAGRGARFANRLGG
ncbi:hypothetical protein BRAS3809_4190002 [Bradyrhizobium sp. STM 3809]|nr:hypothetical protein BRAS3809_4190002 [Bradyrhizobium sp. STM 3809]